MKNEKLIPVIDINNVWRKARKKPVVIEFREVFGEKEIIPTREGTLTAIRDRDYIIKGVEGEIYPCDQTIFHKTYEVLEK